jgi:hypothetical protein
MNAVLVHGFLVNPEVEQARMERSGPTRLASYSTFGRLVTASGGWNGKIRFKAKRVTKRIKARGRVALNGCFRLKARLPLYESYPGTGECVERLKEEVEKRKMPLSGEAIRMMNYVDDVATTMRRLLAVAPTLTNEERKRVSEYLRVSSPNAGEVLAALDKK